MRTLRALLPSTPVAVETIAVGLLERLWHTTIADAYKGDIGKLSDGEIAEACGWFGSARELVGTLVDTGWLDESAEHRLLVHD